MESGEFYAMQSMSPRCLENGTILTKRIVRDWITKQWVRLVVGDGDAATTNCSGVSKQSLPRTGEHTRHQHIPVLADFFSVGIARHVRNEFLLFRLQEGVAV